MDIGTALLAILSLSLGWFLNEVSAYWRGRDLHRAAIGKAVADLMEVEHRLKTMQLMTVELGTRFLATPAEIQMALPAIQQLLPNDQDLYGRYNTAVSEIAAVDPELAFRLRARERIPDTIDMVRALEVASAAEGAPIPDFENYFRRVHLEDLAELILEVSKLHGWRTHKRVRTRLRRRVKLSAEFSQALDELMPDSQKK